MLAGCGGSSGGGEPQPLPAKRGDLASTPWTRLRLADGGRTVLVRYYSAPQCGRTFDHAEAREGASAVEIAVYLKVVPLPAKTACTAVVQAGIATVRLQQPLGKRELRHAAVEGRPPPGP